MTELTKQEGKRRAKILMEISRNIKDISANYSMINFISTTLDIRNFTNISMKFLDIFIHDNGLIIRISSKVEFVRKLANSINSELGIIILNFYLIDFVYDLFLWFLFKINTSLNYKGMTWHLDPFPWFVIGRINFHYPMGNILMRLSTIHSIWITKITDF